MSDRFGSLVGRAVDVLVRWVVLPVTGVIPRLASSGLLFLVFAVLWAGFGAALFASPSTLDDVTRWLGGQVLPVQAVVWLLSLPLAAGLWVLGTDWPFALRLVVIAGLAGWNLVVLVPRRPADGQASPAMGGM